MARAILLLTLVFGYMAGLFAFEQAARSGLADLEKIYRNAGTIAEAYQ